MPYDLVFSEEDGILRVDATGDRTKVNTAESGRAAWRAVAKECTARGLTHVLIVSRITGRYRIADVYDVNSAIAEAGIQPGWKIAYVNLDPPSYKPTQFGEMVAVNRFVQVKLFDNERDAREWLLAG